jgi:hypothetical protein
VAVIDGERQGCDARDYRGFVTRRAKGDAMPYRCFSSAAARIAVALALFGPGPARLADPAAAQSTASIAPVRAGLARVWFLRQFEPGESLQTPMIYVNGAPLAASQPGTVFYRDFAPGTYTFSVDTCTLDTNQKAVVNLVPGLQADLEIQSLNSFRIPDCVTDTFYVRAIPPASAQFYFSQLTLLGAR